MYNAASIGPSSLNSTHDYTLPFSAYPSMFSIPQPIPEGEPIFFNHGSLYTRHQASEYMCIVNGGSQLIAITSAG
jgi:GATA-binding protein